MKPIAIILAALIAYDCYIHAGGLIACLILGLSLPIGLVVRALIIHGEGESHEN